MTLTPEQLDAAIVMIGHFDASEREQAIMRAMYADLAAMRQPITAEALVAAGWLRDTQDRKYTLTIEQRWTFYYDIEHSRLQVHRLEWESSVVVIGLSNMYDVRELLRIVGGAK